MKWSFFKFYGYGRFNVVDGDGVVYVVAFSCSVAAEAEHDERKTDN